MHFLMFYDLAPDYLERRSQFREAHLKHAWDAVARGELLLGGATADPADLAVLLFEAESPQVAQRFAEADPYVQQGLVTAYRIRAWTTVVGKEASTPVKPAA
ncbi:MAG TPA: YciI-like protein [Noviherbaspirillum sp.]|uniref:YciI-like protein n=1 Tax=Noviherbaspirillum sp. TaxID=1926288 RepID=UPI002D263C13|nr:YciI-like protein [Noviherbaspirillum sp.]HYD94897.1 YciI-like protein [Noviherbaspirillum sp.]